MKKLNRLASCLTATAVVAAAAVSVAPGQAQAASAAKPGTTSLAEVLAADGTKFDKNPADFDIAEAAILAVLGAKPSSPLKILTQGKKRVTVFVPTDLAFRKLVKSLTGSAPSTEAATTDALVALVGVDTIEDVLLYHAVVGATLDSTKVVAARGTKVETALGKTFRVKVTGSVVSIVDKDRDAKDARAIPRLLDINDGNKQIAHGISQVLRPADL